MRPQCQPCGNEKTNILEPHVRPDSTSTIQFRKIYGVLGNYKHPKFKNETSIHLYVGSVCVCETSEQT